MIKIRVITEKDQLERTVKTLNKASTFHIEISEEVEAFVHTSLEKELHTICNPLIPIDDIIVYLQTGKQFYIKDNINPIYSRHFRESDIPDSSVAFKWN